MNKIDYKWCEIVQKKAKELDVTISPEMCDLFKIHATELLIWNEKKNLTAITDPIEVAIKHFADSSVMARYIESHQEVLDMGAGGGFPGLVLAVQRPDVNITLIDASRKKVAFLQHVIRKMDLSNAVAIHGRVEEMNLQKKFDAITCRAFASIEEIISFAKPLLMPTGSIWAMRGDVTESEEEKSRRHKWVREFTKREYQLPIEKAKRTLVQIRLNEE